MNDVTTLLLFGSGLLLGACTGTRSPDMGEPGVASAMTKLEVSSPALRAGQPIPAQFACTDDDHLGKSPPLAWSAGPEGTVGYAVTVLDPDAKNFVHWAVVDLPPGTTSLPEGASPGGALPEGAVELKNGFGKVGYGGPCPPAGAPHHYVFEVLALRAKVPAGKADAGFFQKLEASAVGSPGTELEFAL